MGSLFTADQFSWEKIDAKPDPVHCVPCTRSSHGVSVLAGGDRIVLYGGEHVARTPIHDEAHCVWICQDSTWKRIDCKGPHPPARVAHAQTVYQNRFVYVFGGRAGIEMQEKAMNDLWVLDTESYEWKQVEASTSPPEARSFHRMVCIGDALYVFGGCGAVSGRLADLHTFDIPSGTWQSLSASKHLAGRGGPNLIPLEGGQLAVVAGFAGKETADGHIFDISTTQWRDEALTSQLEGMRPRSVCASCCIPSAGVALIFGGEVDPSDRGHEGAGGFENDLVILDSKTGALVTTQQADPSAPDQRGWSGADHIDKGDGTGVWFLFGGLAGNDQNPLRLNDLWKLKISKKAT